MKRTVIILSLAIIFIGYFSIVNAQTGIFSKDLYFGMQKDSEVTKLQEFLTSEGLYSGPITGNFFSLTLKAMRDYQTREGISPAAGYFGPLTRAKANAGLSIQIDASNAQATSETGTTPTSPVVPKTTTDAVSTMQSQLDVLLQQVALLQQQLQTQQQTQQTVQNL
ncbi:peptidoglycan-binding protein [bacterium]|nr:MAG: peptidoglycan-binding protein [bacterium]